MNTNTKNTSQCLKFDPELLPANERLPIGTCDCHFHIFPKEESSKLTTNRSYTPAEAPLKNYISLKEFYGISRSILIQPSTFGDDHTLYKDLLTTNQSWMRGVAAVNKLTEEKTVEALDKIGTKGTRINALFNGGVSFDQISYVADLIRPFKWHLQLCTNIDKQPEILLKAVNTNTEVVVDHMGYFQYERHSQSDGFKLLIDLLKDELVWVKLSAPYRLSPSRSSFNEVTPLVDKLIHSNPRRIIWGTDWPHPSIEPPMVKDHELINATLRWLDDPDLKNKVLVENPTKLYWTD